jgi:hypothetical protein
MKTLLLVGTTAVAGLLIAISPVLAQGGQTFRGMAESASGSVLTVSGGGETHRFTISGSTKITGPGGKRSTIKDCLNQSVEVTYSGNKEPYRAISVEALEN